MEKWPNFFIVGAPKAGTGSLYVYLRKIPGIFMCPIKEPHYFDIKTVPNELPQLKTIRDKKKYLSLFSKVRDEKIIGESSPTYLSDSDAPKLIHKVAPNARILISLRDPVELVYSYYLMVKNQGGLLTLPFHEQLTLDLKYINHEKKPNLSLFRGRYTEGVKRYQDIFGIDQVKIIFFEEWTQEPKKTVEEILKFLDINSTISDFKSQVVNPYGVMRGPLAEHIIKSKIVSVIAKKFFPYTSTRRALKDKILLKKAKKPKMDEKDQELLVNFYRDDVEKLQNLLSRELPWSNF